VGADADARTENVRAVDLVARAVAAVAAADAIRASEPSSVHGAGDSTLSQPDLRASPCASAPSPAVSCTPSMETKRQAAVAQLVCTTATTRLLDEESESKDDEDDSE